MNRNCRPFNRAPNRFPSWLSGWTKGTRSPLSYNAATTMNATRDATTGDADQTTGATVAAVPARTPVLPVIAPDLTAVAKGGLVMPVRVMAARAIGAVAPMQDRRGAEVTRDADWMILDTATIPDAVRVDLDRVHSARVYSARVYSARGAAWVAGRAIKGPHWAGALGRLRGSLVISTATPRQKVHVAQDIRLCRPVVLRFAKWLN